MVQRVAIIGGGISGIAAALELSHLPDVAFRIFEGKSRLGGVLETIRQGPYLIERSADNFSTVIPDALRLSQRLGLADDLIQPNSKGRQAYVCVGRKIHPIPQGFSLMQPTRWSSIVMTPTLSWPGKLRLLAEYWVPARACQSTSGQVQEELRETLDDESLESFAIRRLGKEAYERLVEPIVSGIFTADPKTLSMAATMPQFLEMERRCGGLIRGYLAARKKDETEAARKASGARYDSFVAPRLGMSDWIEKLSLKLPTDSICLNTQVSGLQLNRSSDGTARWQLEFYHATSSGPALDGSMGPSLPSQNEFDGVILATPAATTARLLQKVSPEASHWVGGIPYASSAVAALIVNKSDLTSKVKEGFGLVVPRREDRQSLAISFTSNKYPNRAPEDQILLRVFMGGALDPQLLERSDAELLKIAVSEIRELLAWKGNQTHWQSIIRWQNAMPQYLVGHLTRVQAIDQSLASLPSIRLCGAAYQGVGIPQCVRSGIKAAQQVAESLGIAVP